MKAVMILVVLILCFSFFDCSRTGQRGDVGRGYAGGKSGYDSLGRITNNDPDGIPGNSSTYGTGTGVSGQTPAGTGSGTGNSGRSGVGIRESIK